MRDTFLFDLDGTLLSIDMDEFMKVYFKQIALHFKDIIDGKDLINHIMSSTNYMLNNLEEKPNEVKFMEDFVRYVGQDHIGWYQDQFTKFYEKGYNRVRDSVTVQPLIVDSVRMLKEKGYKMVIATNPMFPKRAIQKRVTWAGLDIEDFIHITSYEENHFCKPHIGFFEEILAKIGKRANQCYMVGNDAQEDMISKKLGLETYLITNHIINREKEIKNADHVGDYQEFYDFIVSLEAIDK